MAAAPTARDRPRTGIVISYCLGWLRQAENQYLAVPPEIARTLPDELQRLLGYFVHEPNLGCVEGEDPIRLLKDGRFAPSAFREFIPKEVQPMLEEHRARMLAAQPGSGRQSLIRREARAAGPLFLIMSSHGFALTPFTSEAYP